MPRRLPAVYDPVNGKLYGEDPIVGLLEVATGGGGNVTIDASCWRPSLVRQGSTITGDATLNEFKIALGEQSLGRLTHLYCYLWWIVFYQAVNRCWGMCPRQHHAVMTPRLTDVQQKLHSSGNLT